MNPSDIVNITEIILWSCIGIGFTVIAARRKGSERLRVFILALAFLVFGLSDFIELQTGAWWRPIWLLFMKAACVAVFVLALRRHLLDNTRDRKPTTDAGEKHAKDPASDP